PKTSIDAVSSFWRVASPRSPAASSVSGSVLFASLMQLSLFHSIELVNRMIYSQIRDGRCAGFCRPEELGGRDDLGADALVILGRIRRTGAADRSPVAAPRTHAHATRHANRARTCCRR